MARHTVRPGLQHIRLHHHTRCIVENLLHLAPDHHHFLRSLVVPVNRNHRTRLHSIQHPHRAILLAVAQIIMHTQPGRSHRLPAQLVQKRLIKFHCLNIDKRHDEQGRPRTGLPTKMLTCTNGYIFTSKKIKRARAQGSFKFGFISHHKELCV